MATAASKVAKSTWTRTSVCQTRHRPLRFPVPVPWQEKAVSQPRLVPGTSPSTTAHSLPIGFSNCLGAVVLALLS